MVLVLSASHPDLLVPPPGQRGETANALLGDADIPTDPVKKEVAVRLSTNTGNARSWGSKLEAGTFAAARSEVLTPEEEEFLEAGYDEDDLLATIDQYQGYVESYAGVKVKGAAAGLEKAIEVRDDAVAKLKKLRGINAKLEALAVKFDANVLKQARELH